MSYKLFAKNIADAPDVPILTLTDPLVASLQRRIRALQTAGKSLAEIAESIEITLDATSLTLDGHRHDLDHRHEAAPVEVFRVAETGWELVGVNKNKYSVKRKMTQQMRAEVKYKSQLEEDKRNARQIAVLDAAPPEKRKRAKSTGHSTKLSPRLPARASSPSKSSPLFSKPKSTLKATQRAASPKLKTIAPGIRASSPSRKSPEEQVTAPPLSAAKPVDAQTEQALIHLLAVKPFRFEKLAATLHHSMNSLLPVLKKVAYLLEGSATQPVTDALSATQTLALRPEQFKLVRLHDWSEYTQKDKETVARNANRAFDDLGLKKNAPERFQYSASLVPVSASIAKTESSQISHRSDSGRSDISADSADIAVSTKRKREDDDGDKPSKTTKLNSPITPIEQDELLRAHDRLVELRGALEREVEWLSLGKPDDDRIQGVKSLKKEYEDLYSRYIRLCSSS